MVRLCLTGENWVNIGCLVDVGGGGGEGGMRVEGRLLGVLVRFS